METTKKTATNCWSGLLFIHRLTVSKQNARFFFQIASFVLFVVFFRRCTYFTLKSHSKDEQFPSQFDNFFEVRCFIVSVLLFLLLLYVSFEIIRTIKTKKTINIAVLLHNCFPVSFLVSNADSIDPRDVNCSRLYRHTCILYSDAIQNYFLFVSFDVFQFVTSGLEAGITHLLVE